jgi:endonuclease/exonuclease/phosphatase family metal-dependent hydrolase
MRLAQLAVCLLLAGCARPLPAPDRARGPAVRVMTYNVNFGIAGDGETIAAIAGGGADLVFLQETTPTWEAVLRRELGARYPHQAYRHSGGAGGLAILSRHRFREAACIAAPGEWFPAWRVVVESPLGPLQVLQVHLRPPVSDRGSWVSGYFTTGGYRRGEIAHFARGLRRDLPTLVLGDFNEAAGGKAVRFLEEQHGLRDALERFSPGATTWQWQTSVGRIRLQLDHILHDARLRALDARVLRVGRSDHYPVVATFVRAGGARRA